MKLINKTFLIIVFFSAIATFFAFRAGQLKIDDASKDVFVSLNLDFDTLTEHTILFKAQLGQELVKREIALIPGNNIVTFSVPLTTHIKNWEIRSNQGTVHFNGAVFSTGKSSVYVTRNQVLEHLGNTGTTIKSKTEFDLKPITFLKTTGIVTGIIVWMIGLLYTFLYRNQTGTLLNALIVSFLFCGLSYFIFTQLREEVDNINVTLTSENQEKLPIELYYAQSVAFSPNQLLKDSLSRIKPGEVQFQLPAGHNRFIRIDLPATTQLNLKSITIRHWLGKIVLKGNELCEAFSMCNDIPKMVIRNNQVQIQTGRKDPYLILTSPEIHTKLSALQIKKIEYPLWLSILIFLVFIPIIMRTYGIKGSFFMWLFCLFIIAPGISTVLKSDVSILVYENRPAFNREKLSGSRIKDLPQNTTSYINDQFGGRQAFTTSWNMLRITTFNQTNINSPVVVGKNGWLFYVAEGVREMVENKHPISTDSLALMCAVLDERNDWLKLHGIDYYLVIPPLSHTMYKENLPNSLHLRNKESKLDQFINYAKQHSKTKIIDLRIPLFIAKKKEKRPLYYNVDSHWNLLGAWYGYNYIMQEIRKDHPEFETPTSLSNYMWIKEQTNEGDLAKLLAMNNFLLRNELIPIPKQGYKARLVPSQSYASYVSIHEAITYEQDNKKLPKLCMNRDSYTNFLIPYMSEHFSRSVYLWTPLFNAEVFKEEKPDIVVSEMLERFILDLSLPNPPIVQEELVKAGLR